CRVHRGDRPSPEQLEKDRLAERKRIQNEKLAITCRHRILAAILQKVSAPLKKADAQVIAQYLIVHLSYNEAPALAKRHKIEAKNSDSAHELLMKQVSGYDEAALCKLLLEICLLDSAYHRASGAIGEDVLMNAAKRYRVDAEKLQKAVTMEFVKKQKK